MDQLKSNEDINLVDVREHGEFQKFRIPSSMNVPLFALKTKSFLKSKTFILINEGHAYKQLLDEGINLARLGFKVSILDGGLYQWKRKGGTLDGDVFTQRELDSISPQTLLVGKGIENWILVDVTDTSKENNRPKDQPDISRMSVPYSTNTKGFVQALKAATKSQIDKSLTSIVICDQDGKSYEEIDARLSREIKNVLYLKGGLNALRDLQRYQVMALNPSKAKESKRATDNKNCKKGCP